MAHATVQDLIVRYGEPEIRQLSDRDALGALDETVVGAALDDASAEIDSYLRVRHTLPFDTPPPGLVRAACVLAFADLHVNGAPDAVATARKEVVAWLKDLAAGNAVLVAGGSGV